MNVILIRSLDMALLSVWVGICAAVPEIIWQGGKLLLDHGEIEEFLISALLVGMMLAFFVEPLTERIKARSWSAHHHAQGWTFVTILVAILFGMVTVCIHQCIDTLLHNKSTSSLQETTGLHEAIRIVVQWAFIPTIFTIVWFIGLKNRRLGNLLIFFASILVMLVTKLGFQWHIYNAASSTIVGALASLLVINFASWGRFFYASGNYHLSISAGFCFGLCTLIIMFINYYVIKIDYDGLDYGEDARFYLGWALGLSFLPDLYRKTKYSDAVDSRRV
ncbi:hypothetical protein G3T14_17890 [Methylobacterium sp. BTF04]|uniref:hypothetical protein n=1 Tax=Methylobacterium sp. BTF04 TaxID=2708300 RepID=UPI0013D74EC8|nr:hypothetical protein [Methylobacterium sp. BTF04]NEU13986.1 hypothetical protein [Methylobacterium sp. BTF04]